MPIFRVWVDVEQYDEDDPYCEGEDLDLHFGDTAEFTDADTAIAFAQELHRLGVKLKGSTLCE